MSFSVFILGSNSSLPAFGRHHSSQYFQSGNSHFLIDCGEGTQYQLLKYKLSHSRISAVFISHLHGDHYLGLMGLLFSMHLTGRDKPLTIFGPTGLSDIITTHLRHSGSVLCFDLDFIETSPKGKDLIHETNEVRVFSFPLTHRIPCTGFLFVGQQKSRKIIKDRIPENFLIPWFENLKAGEDIKDENGNILYRCSELTLPPEKPKSYAYCSDTGLVPGLEEILFEVDLLYHETTFLKDSEEWARKTFHSTTHDAARLAKQSKVNQLLIGHFSARYKDVDLFTEECRQLFPNTLPAMEGEQFSPEHHENS